MTMGVAAVVTVVQTSGPCAVSSLKWQSIQMSELTFCVHGARPSSGLVVNPSIKIYESYM